MIAHDHGRHRENWLEGAGACASMLCLVHCLAMPLLIAALPALGRILPVSEDFHVWVLAFAIPASGAALLIGRNRHGIRWPLASGAGGLALLAIGALVLGEGAGETAATVAASLLLAVAHIANWRLRRSCAIA